MSAFQQIPNLPAGGAVNGTELGWFVQSGVDVRLTTAQIAAYVQQNFPLLLLSLTSRVVLANANAAMLSTDVVLLINKTVGGATSVPLVTPALGRLAIIKDMKGDAGANNITIDAGSGNLINNAQTSVLSVNYAPRVLIGASATQWGIIV